MSQIIQDQFADIRILKFPLPDIKSFDLKTRIFIYYLSEAAICGRDILFDQHYKYNLAVRTILEQIVIQTDSTKVDQQEYNYLLEYLKRVWFSSGIHHHYSTNKFKPGFKVEFLKKWFHLCDWSAWFNKNELPIVLEKLIDIIFNPTKDKKRVSQDSRRDLIIDSANNFYHRITQKEAEEFYKKKKEDISYPPSFGLNSQLIKDNSGAVSELIWKSGGKYSNAIDKVIYWLNKAVKVALNSQQTDVINILIDYYKTGDIELFDKYNISWLKEQDSPVDFINGFIEVYGDPLGIKGSWEALVNVTDIKETGKVKVLSNNAQWFENYSPIDKKFKKEKVKGVNMKIIHAITLGGDCYPASPLGINLPNADWIREKYGSKSVSLSNISDAHHLASISSGLVEEFAFSKEEIELHRKYGSFADHLHTHLHECLGHGSGKLSPGITSETLKSYSSTIEETRADLFGLYFIMDQKMIDLNLMPNFEVAQCQYNSYIRNGMMVQLTRIEPGEHIEQAHMRNRQLISSWVYINGNGAIRKEIKKGKTYFVIQDYDALRNLFGKLLNEVQRIKSDGDYNAAKTLVETYGVNVDKKLHQEVLDRYLKLNLPPFTGFLNPRLTPVRDKNQNITDVLVSTDETYFDQMTRYSRDYGFLVEESMMQFKQST